VNFIGVILIGGTLNLSKYNLIGSCWLTETTINKGTFHRSDFEKGRINIMTRQKYKSLGEKTLPLITGCILRNCTIKEANIYFGRGGHNLFRSTIISGEVLNEEEMHMHNIMPLKSENLLLKGDS
ncbi:MAG: hypothetical protein ACTSV7_13485, partial [Candidatus Baldrarchaeia archaeon]